MLTNPNIMLAVRFCGAVCDRSIQELTSVLQGLFSIARKSETQRKPFGPLDELYVKGEELVVHSVNSPYGVVVCALMSSACSISDGDHA